MKKVFLGGTWNESSWRNDLIKMIKIKYFNPIVENWTPDCMKEERQQRQKCDFCLYVITSEMTGVYSIAEVVDDSNKRPQKTIFCFIENGFTEGQARSLSQVGEMVKRNGGKWLQTLKEVAEYLN